MIFSKKQFTCVVNFFPLSVTINLPISDFYRTTLKFTGDTFQIIEMDLGAI